MKSLANAAATLNRRSRWRNGARRALPTVFLFTDPKRGPDPTAVMRRLPRGAAVVFRPFGRGDAESEGLRLAAIARAQRLIFLVGGDVSLARRLDADGVHLPERLIRRAPRIRQAHPRWIITTGSHGSRALALAAAFGLHGAMLSAVFPAGTTAAAPALGPLRFARLVRAARLPVIGLGGVDARTIKRLANSGAAGVAVVETLVQSDPPEGSSGQN